MNDVEKYLEENHQDLNDEDVSRIISDVSDMKLKLRLLEEYRERITIDCFRNVLDKYNYDYKVKVLNIFMNDVYPRQINHIDTTPVGFPSEFTMGIEIEFLGRGCILLDELDFNQLGKKLGLSDEKTNEIVSDWDDRLDYSMHSSRIGLEYVSPILKDDEKGWQNIDDFCSFLQNIGCETTPTCGGHIHIGADILGYDNKAWENFFRIWIAAEPIIYKMSNAPGDVVRPMALKYSKKASGKLQAVLDKGSINVRNAKDLWCIGEEWKGIEKRRNSVNLGNLGKNQEKDYEENINTIEFRLPNGTLEPKTIKENILLYGTILTTSVEMAKNPEHKKQDYNTLLNTKMSERERAKVLMDLLFDDEYLKQIYMERFYSVENEKIYEDFER